MMKGRGKKKGDPTGGETLLQYLLGGIDPYPQVSQDIRATATTRNSSVPVLGHWNSSTRNDESRGGGDIESSSTISTCPGSVHQLLLLMVQPHSVPPHPTNKPHNLFNRFSF